METEQRGQPVRSRTGGQPVDGRNSRVETKPFNIPKRIVFEAFKRVKANKGGYGVDAQSLTDFETDLGNTLYKLWNRMSSGSYHPPPVMRVEIEKPDGVISPLLANLFLHYVFDVWVEKNWQGIQFERYADDIVCHCVSEREAKELKALLNDRFNRCGLMLHPAKTKIAYCKGGWNKGHYETVSFDFLGYTFRPRWIKTRRGQQGLYFLAAVSQKSAKWTTMVCLAKVSSETYCFTSTSA